MIEIHLCDDEGQPRVIRTPGEITQIRVSQYMAADEILAKLAIDLDADEYQSFINLWSDDSHPRVFNKQGAYLVIKDKI
jgi:hypothetical protein